MRLQEVIARGMIGLFVRPMAGDAPVNFKAGLKKARRVLISCPPGEEIFSNSKVVTDLTSLFPKEGLVVIQPGHEAYSLENYGIQCLLNHPVAFVGVPKQSDWRLFRSRTLRRLSEHRFDVLVDLDPDFSLLNAFLCRLLHPPIRMSFSKNFSRRFYNLEYTGKPGAPYTERLDGFFRFLRSLVS